MSLRYLYRINEFKKLKNNYPSLNENNNKVASDLKNKYGIKVPYVKDISINFEIKNGALTKITSEELGINQKVLKPSKKTSAQAIDGKKQNINPEQLLRTLKDYGILSENEKSKKMDDLSSFVKTKKSGQKTSAVSAEDLFYFIHNDRLFGGYFVVNNDTNIHKRADGSKSNINVNKLTSTTELKFNDNKLFGSVISNPKRYNIAQKTEGGDNPFVFKTGEENNTGFHLSLVTFLFKDLKDIPEPDKFNNKYLDKLKNIFKYNKVEFKNDDTKQKLISQLKKIKNKYLRENEYLGVNVKAYSSSEGDQKEKIPSNFTDKKITRKKHNKILSQKRAEKVANILNDIDGVYVPKGNISGEGITNQFGDKPEENRVVILNFIKFSKKKKT